MAVVELKTLKDIFPIEINEGYMQIDKLQKGLRQEAIKWIKELKWAPGYYACDTETDKERYNFISKFTGCGCCGSDELVLEWIKHFFNITEEDLK